MGNKKTILCGLALLAATGSLILTIQEKKRSKKQRAVMTDYIDAEKRSAEKVYAEREAKMAAKISDMEKKISDLENGIIPDFEEAKAAAKAVDDFNKGLSNILGFDPMETLQKERQKAMFGGEVE